MKIPEDGTGIMPWPIEALPNGGNYFPAGEFDRVVGMVVGTPIFRGMPILPEQIFVDASETITPLLNNRLTFGTPVRGEIVWSPAVLADLHIRSGICSIVACSGQFACSVTFRHNLLYDGKDRRCPCVWSNVQRLQ